MSLIIAHRGESFDAPENTLAAIKLALERNAEAIEIDIQLSADKEPVVIHDASTLRLGGRFKKVSSQTYNELRQLDVGNYKGEKYAGERIPHLSEVLNLIPSHVELFIEVKGREHVSEILKKYENLLNEKSIKFISFNAGILSDLKKVFPRIPTYFIYEKNKSLLRNSIIEKLIVRCKKSGFEGLDLDYRLLKKKEDVEQIKSQGLSLYVWTVDNPSTAKKLLKWGVDGITTNRAAWLKSQLDQL